MTDHLFDRYFVGEFEKHESEIIRTCYKSLFVVLNGFFVELKSFGLLVFAFKSFSWLIASSF